MEFKSSLKFLKKQETHITSLYKWMENNTDISSHDILRIILIKMRMLWCMLALYPCLPRNNECIVDEPKKIKPPVSHPTPVSSTSVLRWPVVIQPANHIFCSHPCVFTHQG